MINALLMLAAVGIGFGGSPWAAAAICGALVIAFGIPGQLDTLRRYKRQPKADIVLVLLFRVCLAIAGTFAAAWLGYGLRLLLAHVLRTRGGA